MSTQPVAGPDPPRAPAQVPDVDPGRRGPRPSSDSPGRLPPEPPARPEGSSNDGGPGLQLARRRRVPGWALAKGDGTAVWSAPWAEIAEVAAPERSKLPGGGLGWWWSSRQQRSHRFVVPADRPADLEAALDSVARRHAASPGARRPSPSRLRPGARRRRGGGRGGGRAAAGRRARPTPLSAGPRPSDRGVSAGRAVRRSSTEISAVASPPHWGQWWTWRQDRSSRVPSGFNITTKDSESGSRSSPKYSRHEVEALCASTSTPLRMRRNRMRSVSKIQVL